MLVDGEKEEQEEQEEEAQPHDPASLHAPSFSSMSTSAPTPATRNMAGVAYAARGEFEAAQACFQDAFRLASSSVASKGWHALEPVYNLAALYWATGALQNARELLLYMLDRLRTRYGAMSTGAGSGGGGRSARGDATDTVSDDENMETAWAGRRHLLVLSPDGAIMRASVDADLLRGDGGNAA